MDKRFVPGEGAAMRSDMLMTLGVYYNANKSILDELETIEFRLGQTKLERVAIIQFRMNKCCSHCGCSFQIKIMHVFLCRF